MDITSSQCKAARGLLGWSQAELAKAARVNIDTLIAFENSTRATHRHTILAFQKAFEEAGLLFVDENGAGIGVRFRDPGRR